MKTLLQAVIVRVLRISYALVKLVTTQNPNKIVFLGRHTTKMPLDFRLLAAEIGRRQPEAEIVLISQAFEGRRHEIVPFTKVLFRSLYHLATSKVCMIDSYWPAVSVLQHREGLVIYQMWHSLGKMKQSGRQSIGKVQGQERRVAQTLRMHEGYDYVIGGAPHWNPFYVQAFDVAEERILNYGLPRADFLVQRRSRTAQRILGQYPELGEKPLVLYAPTFRRGKGPSHSAVELASALAGADVNLVIKPHKDQVLLMPDMPHLDVPDFTALSLLTVADVVITDYSSIALEAALLEVPTLYFAYDYDEYMEEGGLNIQLKDEMPGCVFEDAEDLAQALAAEYPESTLQEFRKKFLFEADGGSTKRIADHVLSEGGLCLRS